MWKQRLIPVALGLVVLALLAALRVADPEPVQAMRDVTFDNYQRLAPREAVDLPIRIVDIDEASLAAVGQWPWPRDILAELTTRLAELGVAAIAFDIMFPEPDRLSPSNLGVAAEGGAPRDHDQEFAAALRTAPAVLGFDASSVRGLPMAIPPKVGFAVVGPNTAVTIPPIVGATTSLPILVEAATGHGAISLDPDNDIGTVRRLPLMWGSGNQLYPTLALSALRVALGQGAFIAFADQIGDGIVQSVRVGDFEVPTTPNGSLWLYFQPTPDDFYISAGELLDDDWTDLQALVAGHIVFIGTSASGLGDIRGTSAGRNMPGVEIHAQALQQILSGTYLRRADWVDAFETLEMLIIGIAIIAAVIFTSRPVFSFAIGIGFAVVIAAGSWFAFTNAGLLIDPSFPLLGGLIVYALMLFFRFLITDADKRRLRSVFGNYVSPALLGQIERREAEVKLGGEMRELSIMFSDIKDFTTLSEGLTPTELVALLNTLFGALGTQITEQSGTIDKFIGDAIMAFWNAPVDVPDHARRACKAALAMRTTLEEMNRRDAFRLKSNKHQIDELAIRIGISTGSALVGNLGLETRFDYSCVGDTVNVASRVEGACKTVGYDIVVVDATREAAPDMAFLEAGSITLKGKSKREPIHILVGDEELANTRGFQSLAVAHVEAVYALTEGRKANAAIDRCLPLITFPDKRLIEFYETLRTRTGDYQLAADDPAMAGHGHPA
jgi:adenylate cyclase